MYTYRNTCSRIYIYICMYVCISILCIYTHIETRAHADKCTYMDLLIYIYIYIYVITKSRVLANTFKHVFSHRYNTTKNNNNKQTRSHAIYICCVCIITKSRVLSNTFKHVFSHRYNTTKNNNNKQTRSHANTIRQYASVQMSSIQMYTNTYLYHASWCTILHILCLIGNLHHKHMHSYNALVYDGTVHHKHTHSYHALVYAGTVRINHMHSYNALFDKDHLHHKHTHAYNSLFDKDNLHHKHIHSYIKMASV